MLKIRLRNIAVTCYIILCVGLTACSMNRNTDYEIVLKPTVVSEQTDTGVFTSSESMDSIGYNQYLKKIWIIKSNASYSDSFAFYISEIKNEIIKGKLAIHNLIIPTSNPPEYHLDLSGTIGKGVAECQFRDEKGNKGNLTLMFKENSEIEAIIEYTDSWQYAKEYVISSGGQYLLRPYNLADIDVYPNKEHSFETDLDSWGSVNFVTLVVADDKPYPTAYLTNEHGDVFYEFSASFQVGTEIIDVSIEDINGDGLKDVKIITGFFDYDTGSIYPDMPQIERIFLQMDNGMFELNAK